jgi:hypothetical protein
MEKFPWDSDPDIRPIDPMKAQLARELHGHLLSALNDWSDEIPDQIHHDGKYKVRINWWNSTAAFLRIASKKLVDDPELRSRIKGFNDKYTDPAFWKGLTTRTTKEDIETANRVIRTTLDYLKGHYPDISDE